MGDVRGLSLPSSVAVLLFGVAACGGAAKHLGNCMAYASTALRSSCWTRCSTWADATVVTYITLVDTPARHCLRVKATSQRANMAEISAVSTCTGIARYKARESSFFSCSVFCSGVLRLRLLVRPPDPPRCVL